MLQEQKDLQIVFLKTLMNELEIDIENSENILNLNFKQLSSWSSMKSLLMVIEVEEKFGVLLSGEDVKNANTFADIFETVNRLKTETKN